MADLIQIDTLTNKYSDNLLTELSLFNEAPTITHVGTGSVTIVDDYSVTDLGKSAEVYFVQDVIAGVDETFSFGDALKHTAVSNGNHVFSFQLYSQNINCVSDYYFDFTLNVYVNSVLTETFTKQVFPFYLDEGKFFTFAQSFDLAIGEEVNFSFSFLRPSVGTPNPNFRINLSGFKLELDNKFLFNPTPYSLPNSIFALNSQTQNFSFISSLDDLPNESSGIINLKDNYTYFFTKSVDLNGNRLVCGQNTVILGTSSENVVLSSTGLTGVALITSNYALPIRNITITADVALNLNGTTSYGLDWFGVNFTNCATVGTIQNYSNHVWTDCAFLESGNLTYNGTIGSIALNSSLFNTASGQTAFIIPSTCTITRRFRANLCAFIIGSGETGINLSTSASIPNESYILRECNFSGGGTYTTGVLYSDNKSRFRDNIGVPNSNEISQYYMNGNATPTIISSTGVPVKILGTTISASITQRFDNTTSNKSTYLGSVTRVFEVVATISLISGNNNQIGAYIAKNGVALNESEMYVTTTGAGKAENVKIQTLVSLSTNDYIELFVENNTAVTNITVSDLNLIIK